MSSAAVARDPFKPSKQDQLNLGRRAAAEVRQQEKVLPANDPRTRLVRQVGSRILRSFQDRDLPWEYTFDVIDSKEVNAFALPGGPIFIYTGLLDKMKTVDELAGVMAHEIIHVRREHWAYQYRDQIKAQGILTILSLAGVGRDLLNLGALTHDAILSTQFSRRHETEADVQGYDLMTAAGYNPRGMVDLFKMFEELNRGRGGPEWLRTHPADSRRIRSIEERIAKDTRKFPAQTPMPASIRSTTSDRRSGESGT